MRVKCVRLSDSKGNELSNSSWYSVGKVYDVLELSVSDKSGVSIRLESDEIGTPALFPLSDFEIVDGTLPRNWIIVARSGFMRLTPAAWAELDFMYRFFNDDPDAMSIFRRERDIIVGSE